LERSYITDSV